MKKLLLIAAGVLGIVALLSAPAFAGGAAVLSDTEMDEISAASGGSRSSKIDLNNDGVQLNDEAQEHATVYGIVNENRSATISQVNASYWGLSQSNRVSFSQNGVGNGGCCRHGRIRKLRKFDNINNGGVQLNDEAQQNIEAFGIVNANRSASISQVNAAYMGGFQSNSVCASQNGVGNGP